MKATDKAFPLHAENSAGYFFTGLTVRDYIAIQAMIGLLAGIAASYFSSRPMPPYESIAKDCYEMADAMIKQSEVRDDS